MEEDIYLLAKENKEQIMLELNKLPYKDVHTTMYILENLVKLEVNEDVENNNINDKSLIEG